MNPSSNPFLPQALAGLTPAHVLRKALTENPKKQKHKHYSSQRINALLLLDYLAFFVHEFQDCVR